jgi:BMFP domain-containing protein YqiC
MTRTEDLIRLYQFRIEALENKVEELEAKLETYTNNYYAKQNYTH